MNRSYITSWIVALVIVCTGIAGSAYGQLASTKAAIVPSSNKQVITNIANLPPELREQLEKQRAAMKALYIEYDETLSRLGRSYSLTNTAYFEGNRFSVCNDDREYSFDGEFAWVGGKQTPSRRSKARLTKILPADSSDPNLSYIYWKLSYFDAASIYAPPYLSELPQFSSLEPLALHYLDKSDWTEIEKDGGNFHFTVYVDDPYLVNIQKIDPVRYRKLIDNGANPAEFITKELETLKRLRAMVPKRTVSFLLDSQHGYAVGEREERTAAGQRIARFQTENWKFYEGAGIWLPERCVISWYATPYTFKEFSDQPLQKLTVKLKVAEFGKKNTELVLSEKLKYKEGGTHFVDRTLPEVRSNDYTAVMLTVAANGTVLRDRGTSVASVISHGSRVVWICVFLVLVGLPPVVFSILRIKNRRKG